LLLTSSLAITVLKEHIPSSIFDVFLELRGNRSYKHI